MTDKRRRYERIEVRLPCRLFIPEDDAPDGLRFQAFLTSRNLSLGGVFLESTFLMKPDTELFIEIQLTNASLTIRGRIVHVIDHDSITYPTGMGIEFLDMSSEGRENHYAAKTSLTEGHSKFLKRFLTYKIDPMIDVLSKSADKIEDEKVKETFLALLHEYKKLKLAVLIFYRIFEDINLDEIAEGTEAGDTRAVEFPRVVGVSFCLFCSQG